MPLDSVQTNFESANISARHDVCWAIINNNLTEYIPTIKERISNEDLYGQIDYLNVLRYLDSSNALFYVNNFLDSLEVAKLNSTIDDKDYENFKIEAVEMQIYLGETSNADFILNIEDLENPWRIDAITYLLNNSSAFESQAKEKLIYLINNAEDANTLASIALGEKYPDEICDIYKEAIRNNPDYSFRMVSLDDLFKSNCPELRNFIEERIYN